MSASVGHSSPIAEQRERDPASRYGRKELIAEYDSHSIYEADDLPPQKGDWLVEFGVEDSFALKILLEQGVDVLLPESMYSSLVNSDGVNVDVEEQVFEFPDRHGRHYLIESSQK